jgi:2-deoxy-D-gluconate 3-dehydrogenase
LWDDPEAEKALIAALPLGRFGHHGDFSQSAVFLSSPAANCITGTLLTVDGGEWLHGTMFAPVDTVMRG